MNSASVLPNKPLFQSPLTVEEMRAELYRLHEEVRNLVSENNNLKTRLSKALEQKDADLLLEQAEEFQNLFMHYESKLLELCSRGRKQMGVLHLLNDTLAPLCAKVQETVQHLSNELHSLHQHMESTRNAFGAQFSPADEHPVN